MTWSLHIYGNSPKCTVKLCVGVHFPVIFTDFWYHGFMALVLWVQDAPGQRGGGPVPGYIFQETQVQPG